MSKSGDTDIEEAEGASVKKTGVDVRESIRQIKERLDTLYKEAEVRQSLEQIKGRLETLVDDAEKSTREHPLEAIGTCFLAGLAIGILLGTRAGKKNGE